MCEPSLSLAAARARWRPSAGGSAGPLRIVAACLAALLFAGCSTQAFNPNEVLPSAVVPVPSADASPTTPVAPQPTLIPIPEKLSVQLKKVSRSGIGAGGVAVLADNGSMLTSRSPDKAVAPASTMKVLTSLAAVDLLGADHTFTTKVVDAGSGRIVLVGGGDPLLTIKPSKSVNKPASLTALAQATAVALTASGVAKVSLGYDASLFSGAGYSPKWKSTWRSYTARVSSLVVGSGMANKWQAAPDPALATAKAFAAKLKAAGIAVKLAGAAKAPADASELASVQSAPLSRIVARTLQLSDNLAADMLARHVALASGQPATFAGGATATRQWLSGHGLWADGMRLYDGSGLARDARVTPSVLAHAVQLSLNTERLAAVAQGLPVAGQNGTLKDRFNDKSEKAGRGNVHAKTGTLRGIAALAGYLTTADGARLAFALMATNTVGQTTAYNWLDRTAAAMVRCGCS
ncbi:MAG TPA: D-alanyl-D-alanine carboxypeptidase/D-alanyl-D-alanine-endopeptidase [Propionicimonas sp.]|nr:D-alanyl-D-alanine carboxypeptidase/D-alanyl-D-alanine-endopeptidase [Propionicimonas sp.]HQD97429.1 D-alanyl-D-alanine carboxypeptidase/D-alanyl-D-alanine-endopeptidase [Propionicimonas sp.]